MLEFNRFVYLKDKELKKAKKIKFKLKKITLVSYKDSLTYYLYNIDSDFIIISCSVNINKDKILIEKSNKTVDKILVLINKIIETSLLIKTFLATNKIIKTLSLITKLVKTSQIIKSVNLDH